MTIRLAVEAASDLQEARAWYDSQQRGRGAIFLQAFDDRCVEILNAPDATPRLFKSIRAATIERHPYRIIYFLEEDEIVVIAVVHASRHDRTWKRRIGSVKR